MTDNKLLPAISEIMEKKIRAEVESIKVDMKTVKDNIESIKTEQKRINLIIENEIRADVGLT